MKKLTLVIYNLLRICLLLGCNKPNCSGNIPKVIVFLGNIFAFLSLHKMCTKDTRCFSLIILQHTLRVCIGFLWLK